MKTWLFDGQDVTNNMYRLTCNVVGVVGKVNYKRKIVKLVQSNETQ